MTPLYSEIIIETMNMVRKLTNRTKSFEILTESASRALKPDLCCLYLLTKDRKSYELSIKKGYDEVPDSLSSNSELIQFLNDSNELVCLNTRKTSPFSDILLSDNMSSGLAVTLVYGKNLSGILIVNSASPLKFTKHELTFLDTLRSLV